MRRLGRATAAAAITGLMVWFGVTYGPTPIVHGDIYTDILASYRTMPDLANAPDGQRSGYTLLNTNKIYYRVSQVNKSVREVLDDYEKVLTPKEFSLFRKDRLPDSAEFEKVVPEIPFLAFLLNKTRIVREEWGDRGLVSFLDMGPEANRDWHAVFSRKMEAFSKSGRLGDLGVAKTVVAVPSGLPELTTVISYWTDEEFNLHYLEDLSGGDLPGRDVEGFPRIYPSRRLFTFEQKEDGHGFTTVMYQTGLRPDAALASSKSEAEQRGWSGRHEKLDSERGEVLFMNRGPEEVQAVAYRENDRTFVVLNHRFIN